MKNALIKGLSRKQTEFYEKGKSLLLQIKGCKETLKVEKCENCLYVKECEIQRQYKNHLNRIK